MNKEIRTLTGLRVASTVMQYQFLGKDAYFQIYAGKSPELPVAPGMRDPVFGPEPSDHLDSLGKPAHPLRHGHAEYLVLLGPIAEPNFKRFQITLSSPFSGFILAQGKFHDVPLNEIC
jgi:hypothetical protein